MKYQIEGVVYETDPNATMSAEQLHECLEQVTREALAPYMLYLNTMVRLGERS